MIKQINIKLEAFPRGFHLVTARLQSALNELPRTGLVNIFLKHTSAGLTINENADPTVREDFEYIFNKMVPENDPEYKHTFEGPDDMPAHIKSTLTNNSVTIPIQDGQLALGTWQGLYLCEFRNHAGPRNLLVTIYS